jgi:hypothetical protein
VAHGDELGVDLVTARAAWRFRNRCPHEL